MIRFLHRGNTVELAATRADLTVLEYLRDELGACGTKEGCASGDCGACTVVTVRADDNALAYEPMNACIAPLGSLDGKALITVEDLRQPSGLHPVQQAMVDAHGSQCGFCTPGFIMSLFALFHSSATTDRHDILEALGGNLCRCTGYRPIIDAAMTVLDGPREDQFSAQGEQLLAALQALAESPDPGGDRNSTYLRPTTPQDLGAAISAHPQARLVAGGTDLMLDVTQNLADIETIIDVRAVPLLQRLERDERALHVGAAVTHRRLQGEILKDYPELKELIERFGALQIRSQGTLGGNIANASPIGDWPPVLLALDAAITLSNGHEERTMPLQDFFLDYRKTALQPGEFLQSISIPARSSDCFLRAYKVSKRYEDDISSVCLVIALTMDGDTIQEARIACGGMAAIPKRAPNCEAALAGLNLADGSMEEAMAALDGDFAPISDARSSAEYRRVVARNLLLRLQREFNGTDATRAHEELAYHA